MAIAERLRRYARQVDTVDVGGREPLGLYTFDADEQRLEVPGAPAEPGGPQARSPGRDSMGPRRPGEGASRAF